MSSHKYAARHEQDHHAAAFCQAGFNLLDSQATERRHWIIPPGKLPTEAVYRTQYDTLLSAYTKSGLGQNISTEELSV